jgi:hypothetical protein
MDSSARVKLLAALLGLVFLGSVVYLVLGGKDDDAPAAKPAKPRGTGAAAAPLPGRDYPRCPECGKELPSSGECPYCTFKKKKKPDGSDEEPVSRTGRFLAWSMVGITGALGAFHLGRIVRQHRRAARAGAGEEPQLKMRCPHCKRRVRFAARLAHRYGFCPTCRQPIQFKPEASYF